MRVAAVPVAVSVVAWEVEVEAEVEAEAVALAVVVVGSEYKTSYYDLWSVGFEAGDGLEKC